MTHSDQTLVEVNGDGHAVSSKDGRTLLDYLRNQLHLTGAKPGCERGECGACTVLVGGRPRPSCLVLVSSVGGPITTIEGLAHEIEDLRSAFADAGAFQCGYCTPGQLVSAEGYLRSGGASSDHEIRAAMQGNICRCTGYTQIVTAVRQVAEQRRRGAAL